MKLLVHDFPDGICQCQKKYKNKYTQRKIKSNTNCSKKRVPIPLPWNYRGVSQSPVQPFSPIVSGSDRSLQAADSGGARSTETPRSPMQNTCFVVQSGFQDPVTRRHDS